MDGGIFISYARDDDEPFVERLRDDLVAHGHAVWWDRASMRSRGVTFLAEIRAAIESARRLLLVVGPNVRNRSYVEVEWRHALRHGVVVTPILRLGAYADLPPALAALHCEDVREHVPETDALAAVRRLVATPVLGPCRLIGVPRLPSPFIARPDLLDRLLARVLVDAYQPIDLQADQRITSIVGMAGVGKSVLACALAQVGEVRRSFQGGIVWIAVGKGADTVGVLIRVGLAIGADLGNPTGAPEARILLSRALESANCLLVLDDVWDAGIVEAVHLAAGKRVRILLTSRHHRIFQSTGVHVVEVDVMSDGQARELLAEWTATPVKELGPEAADVIAECGSLPLALSMIGAVIRGRRDRWRYALERLRGADPAKVGARIPDYRYETLDRAMAVSFEDLDQAVQRRYVDLAAVPEGTPAPGRMLQRWWSAEGMDPLDAVDLLDQLAERSLVRVRDDDTYALHDVQRDFLLRRVGDVAALHERWLTAFRSPDGWVSAQDDGYLFDHLGHHLRMAGRTEEWRALLTSFAWLDRKTAVRGFPAVLRDLAAETGDAQITLLERECRRAAHALTHDPSQLAAQLLARLDPASGGPAIAGMLATASARRKPGWLCPVTVSLSGEDDPLQVVFRGREQDGHAGTPRSIALSPDSGLIATAGGSSNDLTTKLWAVGAATLLRTFGDMMEAGHSAALGFVGSDGRVAVAAGDTVTVLVPTADEPVAERAFAGRSATTVCGGHGDGVVIVGFTDGGLVRWDSADDTAITLREPDGDGILGLAHAESAARVVVATSAGIECRQSEDAELVDRVDHASAWVRSSFQPGLLVVDAAGSRVWYGNPAWLWTVGMSPVPLPAGTGDVIAMTPDGRTAVAAVPDLYGYAELLVVGVGTGEHRGRIRNSREISCVALSRDSRIAVTADFEHDVKVWDLDRARREPTDWERRGPVWQASICDGGALAAVGTAGAIEVWDAAAGRVLGGPDTVGPHRLVRRGVKLLGADISVRVRSRMEALLTPAFDDAWLVSRHSAIGFLAISPAAGRAVTAAPLPGKGPDAEEPVDADVGREPGGIWIWDLHDLRAVRRVTGRSGLVSSLSITSDGRYALSGSEGRVVRLWDLDAGTCLCTLRGHRGIVRTCALTDDARYAISGSEDMTVRLWDLRAGALLFTFATTSAVTSCDIAADGSVAIAGEMSGRVHLFEVRP